MSGGKPGSETKLRVYFFREWREAKGLSQQQLGECMGIAAASVSRIENGQRPWTQSYLEDFSEILDCKNVWDPLVAPPTVVEKVPLPLPKDEFEALMKALQKRIKITARAMQRQVRKRLENDPKRRRRPARKKPSADSA